MINTSSPITKLGPFASSLAKPLKNLGLLTVHDLIFYFPYRYDDLSKIVKIRDIIPSEIITTRTKIQFIRNFRSSTQKRLITEALTKDETGSIRIIWFNQPYLTKILHPGEEVYFSGRAVRDFFGFYLRNPQYEPARQTQVHTGRIVPVYSLTSRLTQKQLRALINFGLKRGLEIPEWLPEDILKKYNLPAITSAVYELHFPKSNESLHQAERRLKFNKFFILQLAQIRTKLALAGARAVPIKFRETDTKKFVASLPFKLTDAQRKAAWEILQDLGKAKPMNRLLNGDVGSGKTVVAAIAALNVAKDRYQSVFLAPTEILAIQHFNTLSNLLKSFRIKIALLTANHYKLADFLTFPSNPSVPPSAGRGRIEAGIKPPAERPHSREDSDEGKALKKSELKKKIKNGEIDLVIGTHALLEKDTEFKKLALVIVDEQHRFGVHQRQLLRNSNRDPKNPNTSEFSESNKNGSKLVEKDLSYALTGIFFEIHKELGRFCREKQYADRVAQKLQERGLSFQREFPIDVNGNKSNIVDFLIEKRIIVELKAKPIIEKNDYYQTQRYLDTANLELGLIVNFRQTFLKPKRVLNPRFNSEKFGAFGCHSDNLDRVPHFLSMTATPIPRTLALTIYGDLDMSILDEMPPGRKKIKTKLVSEKEKLYVYDFIKQEIKKGRQVFCVCPLIDPSDILGVKSVKEMKTQLEKDIFPEFRIAMLHGKMRAKEKEKIMREFIRRKHDILISTSVIEVGVDVPNASVMMIEGAERFGLAQLHQFRGRVGRSEYESFCFLFSDSLSSRARARLKVIEAIHDGFELAEKDLEFRGAGEIFGTIQSGFRDDRFLDFSDIELIKISRDAAAEIISEDSALGRWPVLRNKVEEFVKQVHPE